MLVPLDRRGQWYRYHHRFRDMLPAELERLEPGLLEGDGRFPPHRWDETRPGTRWTGADGERRHMDQW